MRAGRKSRLRVLHSRDVPAGERGLATILTIVRLYAKVNDALARQAEPFGLTLPHLEVLLSLKGGEGISQQDLADRLLVTKGNICVILQKMESSGLVERRTDATDQRFHRLYMTDAGRELVARVLPGHRKLLQRMVGGLTLEEQKTLYELLMTLDDTVENLDE